MGFCVRITRDIFQIVRTNDAHTAPDHLLKIAARANGTHKNQTLKRLYIGAGRNHINTDCDPRVELCAKSFDEIFRLITPIGNLLAEIIASAEYFSNSTDNILGV